MMVRFSLRALITFVFIVAVSIVFYREPIMQFFNLADIANPLTEISNPEELEKALTSSHAIIFAHVDWSIHSEVAKKQVNAFALHWKRRGESPKVEFFMLNLTDVHRGTPGFVCNWLESDKNLNGLSSRGSGDVVWLKNGIVQRWMSAFDATVTELNVETERVFDGS